MNIMIRQFQMKTVFTVLIFSLVLGACTVLPSSNIPEDSSSLSKPTPSSTIHPTIELTLTTGNGAETTEDPNHQLIPTPQPTNTPTVTPLPPSPTPTPLPQADIVDDLWEWRSLAGPSDDIAPSSDFDGEVLTWGKTWSQPEVQLVQVGESTWELHQAPPGWLINDVQITDGRIVLVEFNEKDGDYNLWVYEVASGERTLLEAWAGEPHRHQVPLIAPDGHRLAWSTTLKDGRSCLRIRDLNNGTQFDAICSHDDSEVLDWPYLRWPILTYQKQIVAEDSQCRTLHTLELPDGEPQPHAVTECEGFQGAADEDVIVWTEMPADTSRPWRVPIYGQAPEGEVVHLGLASAGSVAVCEGRAYWQTKCSNCPDEIRSWVPGKPVEVIYRSPDEEDVRTYIHTLPMCHNSLVMIQRAGGLHNAPGSPDEILSAWRPGSTEE